jgi:hypothetical protein
MCGRYTYRQRSADIVRLYRLSDVVVPPDDLIDRYKLAPSRKAPWCASEMAGASS